ncbi:uncharacterized protein LOC124942549 [Impatiens glandulifera]|uniref:uncharacterized protein LOC124942549 n=1 Tax=Impatiens glandulifera TaxID=253017 RepID=UPI001FB07F31|nr:uncharacterized protein LOC124942549 [Impatiens glandulifera]
MDFRQNHASAGSPSSSTSSTSAPNSSRNGGITINNNNNRNQDDNPMHSWWESISRARNTIHALSNILSPSSSSSLNSLADSDRPAFSLLSSPDAYASIAAALSSPLSGTGDDSICQWLYDTYQSSDTELRLVVLSFIPLVAGIYLSRIHSFSSSSSIVPSLAGFEAVLLVLYSAETKSRAGKPILVTIPDLSQPSLYHAPRNNKSAASVQSRPSVGVLSAPLEPQIAVKSTKRACIVGVALDCYYKQISQMPSWSKLEFCQFASDWAGQDCPCKSEFDSVEDDEISDEMRNLQITVNGENSAAAKKETRIPLPWELLQPVLRILGHCLLAPLNGEQVKNGAAMAVRSLYARASHDLVPQAILATRSLIQLDKRGREVAKAAAIAANSTGSNANTPKSRKPEILLVSK